LATCIFSGRYQPGECWYVEGSHHGSAPNIVELSSHTYWWDDHFSDIQRNTTVCWRGRTDKPFFVLSLKFVDG
jgi:hypothetical protein